MKLVIQLLDVALVHSVHSIHIDHYIMGVHLLKGLVEF